MCDHTQTREQLDQQVAELQRRVDELQAQNQVLQAERNIEQSVNEARWRSLFELLPVGVSVVEPARFISLTNPALREILNLPNDAFLQGKHLQRKYFHADLTPLSAAEFPSVRVLSEQQIVRDVEIGIEKEDGTLVWTSVSAAPLPNDGGVVVVTVDITARKQTEDSLRKSEAILRGVLNATRESIWLFSPDGVILLGNETAFARLRRPAEEVIGKPFSQFVPPELVQPRQQCLDAVTRTGAPVEMIDERGGYIFQHTFYPIKEGERVTQVAAFSRDITDRRRSEEAVRKAHDHVIQEKNHLSAVLQVLPVGVAILDENGGIIQSNQAYDQIWGLERPEVKGVADYEPYKARWADSGRRLEAHEWASALAVEKGETVIGQLLEIERFDGGNLFVLNSGSPIYDEQGRITGCAVAIMDVTPLKSAQAALEAARESLRQTNQELQDALGREKKLSRTDSLTGVHNRRDFFDIAAHEYAQAQRYQQTLALLMLDIDHFKAVNDMFGHQIGDSVLHQTAQICQQELRSADVLARYGGEEFVILLPNTNAAEAANLAERIRSRIQMTAFDTPGRLASITISLGVAELTASDTLDQLIQHTDQALYAAKNAGRNCVCLYGGE